MGNLVAETDYNGQTTHYTYTAIGQLAGKQTSAGDWIRYFYDAAGRLIQKHATEGATLYSWNDADQLLELKSPNSTLKYQYDDRGQLIEESQNDQVIRYEYDARGYRTARHILPSPWLTEAETLTTLYQYDDNGQLIEVALPEQQPLQLRYDADGNLIQQSTKSGYINHQQVDAKGRITQQKIGRQNDYGSEGTELEESNSPYYAFVARDYRYDAVDNLLECSTSGEQTHWAYDDNNQITQHQTSLATHQYRYNSRLAVSSYQQSDQAQAFKHYSPSGQLTQLRQDQLGSYQFLYNDNGCLIEKQTEQNGFRKTSQRYQWDSESRRVMIESSV